MKALHRRWAVSAGWSALALMVIGVTPLHAQVVCFSSGAGATGNCYETVVHGTPLPWAEARAAAEARTHQDATGHLAVITSAEEQAFVAANTQPVPPSLPIQTLTVNAPPAVAGPYDSITANFGPAGNGQTGDLVLVNDGAGVTSDGCEPLVNVAAVAGRIALIDRGTCTFVVKAKNAQNAGAIAVVIANNVAGLVLMGGDDPAITIPAVSIRLADGNAFKAALPGVNVTLPVGRLNTTSRHYLGGECIGGTCNSATDFTWVTGEPVAYTNWCAEDLNAGRGNEPNGDLTGVLHLFDNTACWNDTPGAAPAFWDSFIVEYECGTTDTDEDGVPDACDADDDNDLVSDGGDQCAATAIPEGAAERRLGTNRFALVNGDAIFDTTAPNGKGPGRRYTTTTTGGCSCEQIISKLGLGNGHREMGCSIGAMDDWTAIVRSLRR